MAQKRRATGTAMNTDDDDMPDDGDRLFRRATVGTRPIRSGGYTEASPRKPAAKARFSRADADAVLKETLQSPSDAVEGSAEDVLSYRSNGISTRVLRKLKRGTFSVQDHLDLHGMTVAEARDALQAFLESALARGLTCVRIVHGKGRGSGHGGPVLKRKVDGWLRQWDVVLAYGSAQPADGGTGALYVLLKRR